MAELCVMVADVLAGKAGEDVDTFDEKSKLVKFNNVLLAVGKFVDIATDWILVAQLHVGQPARAGPAAPAARARA